MITEYYSKISDIDGRNTVFNRKQKILNFLDLDDLTGHRPTEKQDAIFIKLKDGMELVRNCLESPKNLEHNTNELQEIFNSKSLYPIIHNLIKNTNDEDMAGSEYLYDIRRMEIVRMLFDEIKDYLDKSPTFENDYDFRERLHHTSMKLKDTSESILKKDNIIQEQLKLKLNDEITDKEVEGMNKSNSKLSEKQIREEILENKLISLVSDLEKININNMNELDNSHSNSNENRIKSLYLDMYILDSEYEEMKKEKTSKKILEENRTKKDEILLKIKKLRDNQDRVESMLNNVESTEKKFNDKLDNIESFFSPINPINKLKFLLDNYRGMFR